MNPKNSLVQANPESLKAIIRLVLDGLTSSQSKRAYEKAIGDFLEWYQGQGKPGLTKATVQRYKTVLQESGLAPSSINQRMSAIRQLAQEAADNGLVDVDTNGVASQRVNNRLKVVTGFLKKGAALIKAPDINHPESLGIELSWLHGWFWS